LLPVTWSELSCFLSFTEQKPRAGLCRFRPPGAALERAQIAFPLVSFSGSGAKVKKKRFPLDRKTL
jgi:hypothetical protein